MLFRSEASYRASLERDPEDLDTTAHYGLCLARMGRLPEARPLLERVVGGNPDHDYGATLMTLAEICQAHGEPEKAIGLWRRVLENHSYARARVQLAELLAASGESAAARQLAEELINDDAHAPGFRRGKDGEWVRRAKALVARL